MCRTVTNFGTKLWVLFLRRKDLFFFRKSHPFLQTVRPKLKSHFNFQFVIFNLDLNQNDCIPNFIPEKILGIKHILHVNLYVPCNHARKNWRKCNFRLSKILAKIVSSLGQCCLD